MIVRSLGRKIHFFVLSMLLAAQTCLALPREYISSFQSDIQVNRDASLKVIETIVIEVAGINIKHGIYRSFPTRYGSGYRHFVSFDVERITLDGKSVPYHIERAPNGVYIYIGSKHAFVTRGRHTFEITYKTTRQLGFFDTHDELYWNVTGSEWRFPIMQVSANVQLPESVPAKDMQAAAYIGYQGSKNQSNITYKIGDGSVSFQSGRTLAASEGITIVVGWPKGIVAGPSFMERIIWFFLDIYNLIVICFLCLIFYFNIIKWRIYKENKHGVVIPRFEPPAGFAPGIVRALGKYTYDATCFTADMVNWAVHGLVTISYDDVTEIYTVKKTASTDYAGISSAHKMVIEKIMFAATDIVVLGGGYNERITYVLKAMKFDAGSILGDAYYMYYYTERVIGYILAVLLFLVTLSVDLTYYDGSYSIFAMLLYGGATIAGTYYFRGYTPKGRALGDEIEGFALFLKTTEEDRLKIIGTPPTKTPELYEKYLPYAIALGVEKEWSKKFAPFFAQRERETGIAYIPLWYHGSGYRHGAMSSSFAYSFSKSLNSVIASSSTPPGSSSGFGGGKGGGGSSGGGGGGGGGGGW